MKARATHLKTALKETSRLRALVQDGMAAFAKVDFKLIAEGQRKRIGDSLDLDAASIDEDPQSNRWDYVVPSIGLGIFIYGGSVEIKTIADPLPLTLRDQLEVNLGESRHSVLNKGTQSTRLLQSRFEVCRSRLHF